MNDNHNQDISPSGTDRVELKVLGISYSQIQSGAYALILAEANGPMRLPVVVGGMEAQSIAIKLEGIIPPRPMTHDLFASLMHAYGLQLMEVYIYKFEDGIFSSELTFIDRTGNEVKLDARTSDAIAISMRTGAPIFTTQAILAETGFTMESISHDGDGQPSINGPEEVEDEEASNETRLAALRKALAKAIEEEAYEEASRITSEINELENRKQREDE
ncbi:MAG: bifunctional nuclease family protein [Muribaculaceae bacterium]|nr:bifunctional nuclease family protein [Muribaculaceae bacterium]